MTLVGTYSLLTNDTLPLVSAYSELQWTPTEKQAEFLACPAFELLYGGAAGGGKTDALIVDALGLNQPGGPAIFHPKYRALMIRPELGELDEVIARTRRMYPKIDPGAKYFSGKHIWRFSSGATIEFNYLKKPMDHMRYKGDEFQYVGWEELTLHPSNIGYVFLMTRIRRKPGMEGIIPCVRSTTNPDGPGHSWVKAHWQIPDDGSATKFDIDYVVTDKKTKEKITLTRTRQYMPARLVDNPHIDADYEANLMSTSEDTQRAQKDGRWDIVNVQGIIYQRQVTRVIEEGRLCSLPLDFTYPVDTYWDLGNDNVSIWFVQNIDPWLYITDFYQNSQEGIEHYLKVLQDKGYLLGRLYLPHDADHKRMSYDLSHSIRQCINNLGTYETVIVPRVQNIRDGIELTRQLFSRCRFDRERTHEGWEALKNYKYGWLEQHGIPSQTPVHNWASHPADAFRQIAQARNVGNIMPGAMNAFKHNGYNRGRGLPEAYRRSLALKRRKGSRPSSLV